MTKWQPIETAPVGKKVVLGKWVTSYAKRGELYWVESIETAKRRRISLFSRDAWEYTREGDENTHWQPLPEPPTE